MSLGWHPHNWVTLWLWHSQFAMVDRHGPNRNRWFTELHSMGGSFHGELLVITKWYKVIPYIITHHVTPKWDPAPAPSPMKRTLRNPPWVCHHVPTMAITLLENSMIIIIYCIVLYYNHYYHYFSNIVLLSNDLVIGVFNLLQPMELYRMVTRWLRVSDMILVQRMEAGKFGEDWVLKETVLTDAAVTVAIVWLSGSYPAWFLRLHNELERSTVLLMGKHPLFRLGHFQ